jgi:hypothetical protein
MHLRLPFVLLSVGIAFVIGLIASSTRWCPWSIREAHAQASPFAASVYVPSDGLAFRTFDGRLVAKLSYDEHGGVLELYDEHEQPRRRSDALPPAAPSVTAVAAAPTPLPAPAIPALASPATTWHPLEDRY